MRYIQFCLLTYEYLVGIACISSKYTYTKIMVQNELKLKSSKDMILLIQTSKYYIIGFQDEPVLRLKMGKHNHKMSSYNFLCA